MTDETKRQVSRVRVGRAEAGQKLLSFLGRRVGRDVPKSALMRWVRTGQVRVDGGRAKPFQRLALGQEVRIPPHSAQERAANDLPDPVVVFEDETLLVLAKPAGLPVHGGTGHEDSLQARAARAYPDADFTPTPAHRLDKPTSGLVLFAKTYAGLLELQEQFRARQTRKIYLAWVAGEWQEQEPLTMRDRLDKQAVENGSGRGGEKQGKERMVVIPNAVGSGPATGERGGKEALAIARPLRVEPNKSLLAVELVTGRTHQIRAQLANQGHPIIGDLKYGGPPLPRGLKDLPGILLHAWSMEILGRRFVLSPDWPDEFFPIIPNELI